MAAELSRVRNRYSGDLTVNEAGEIAGVLVPYGPVNSFGERAMPGCFGPVGELAIGLVLQHDRANPVARSPDTMELYEDQDGLKLRARLPDTTAARDALTLLRSGVLTGLSASFIVHASVTQMLSDASIGGEREVEVIQRARLLHAAIVDEPSWTEARVAVAEPQAAQRWAALLAI